MTSAFHEVLVEELRKGEWHKLTPFPNNLNNGLIPFLRRNRWQGLDDNTWNRLQPILRLASAMFTTHGSFLFFYSVINAKRQDDYLLTLKYRTKIAVIGRLDPYSHKDQSIDDVRREYQANLEFIARYVEFRVVDSTNKQWQNAGHYAQTRVVQERDVLFRNYRRAINKGHGCNVFLNSGRLNQIRDLEQLPPDANVVGKILQLQFMLAVTVCHELAHVINRASNKDAYEAFWETLNTAELGHSWEQEVFGGTPWSDPLQTSDIIYVIKWPLVGTHEQAGVEMAERGPGKGSSTFYIVYMPYIQALSSRAFWDTYTPTLDDSLLKIPKVLGQRMWTSPGAFDPKWRQSQSSEGRWPADAQGYVVRPLIKEAVIHRPIRYRYPSRASSEWPSSGSPMLAAPGSWPWPKSGSP